MKIESLGLSGYDRTNQTMQTQDLGKAEAFSGALENAVKNQDDQALLEACQDVESYMISTIFKQLKQSTESDDPLIAKGDYEKMFESNMIDDMASNMTKAGGMGLAKMMYEQMKRY
ncbi:MAG: rod-binding protein [Cellulosilyticaceae bacterium]